MDSKNSSSIKIWIRDDDVSICDERYYQMIQVYKKYNVFTILCAIPTIVEKDCFELIKKCENFVLSQHGYSHKNYKRKYALEYSVELSDSRDINEVVSQMLSGKEKLESISQMPVNILTPPYNRIDKNVEKILSKYYTTLSTFGNNKSSFQIDLNPCIDVINWENRKFDKEHFERKIKEKMQCMNEIGICIHHNFLEKDDISYFDSFFGNLNSKKNIVLTRRLL